MKRNVYFLGLVLVASLLLFYPFSPLMAQADYPNRPIEVIIPYSPGGASDLGVRYLGEKWAEFLGQPIVPVNKPGGGAMIGAKLAAIAKPDGYTLFCGAESSLITIRIGRKDAGYDLDSFRIIFQYSKNVIYFNVRTEAKWKTLNEFLVSAKENPGKLRYASYGIGAITHYAAEMVFRNAGAKLTYLPYKSSPEAVTAMLGGHVDMAVTSGLIGMTDSPLIRTLAVAEEERVYDHPKIPTLKELGYPVVLNVTVSLCGPRGISDEVVKKLEGAHLKTWKKYEKAIKEKLPRLDQYPIFVDGKTAMKIFREKEKKYREMAPLMGIKLE